MPEPFIIYPTGLIATIGMSSPPVLDIFKPLQGGRGVFKTTGAFPLTGFSGRRGTLLASAFSGAAGSNRAVAFLVDRWPSPTRYLGIALDASNRPFAVMSVDGLGTVSGQSTPSGPALPAGQPIDVRLAFDSQEIIHNNWHAALMVEDTMVDIWVRNPTAAWAPVPFGYLLVGMAPVGGMVALNGSVLHTQVSEAVEIVARDVLVPQEEDLMTLVEGNSNLTARAIASWAVRAPLAGASNLIALATAARAAGATVDGTSDLTADLSKTP
jgi:hypothetical protein